MKNERRKRREKTKRAKLRRWKKYDKDGLKSMTYERDVRKNRRREEEIEKIHG